MSGLLNEIGKRIYEANREKLRNERTDRCYGGQKQKQTTLKSLLSHTQFNESFKLTQTRK